MGSVMRFSVFAGLHDRSAPARWEANSPARAGTGRRSGGPAGATGRGTYEKARAKGLVDRLQSAGAQFHSDLCWCSMVEPIFPVAAKTVMTNSGKYACYADGLSGRNVRFGSLADSAAAARSGIAQVPLPARQS